MTGVDTDLATLREVVRSDEAGWDGEEALARVEAELSRLREMLHGPDRVGQMWRRVEAAEAEASRLREQRDGLRWQLDDLRRQAMEMKAQGIWPVSTVVARAEAAEARCARLQQALKELRAKVVPSLIAVKGHLETPYVDDKRWTPWSRFVEPCLYRFDEVLGEALAGLDTPAERVTHGRHCPCSACAREDWTRITGPCGMHGADCPAVYAPLDTPADSQPEEQS